MSKSQLIKIISERSDRYGDKLIDFMERFRLQSLEAATTEQLQAYISSEFKADCCADSRGFPLL